MSTRRVTVFLFILLISLQTHPPFAAAINADSLNLSNPNADNHTHLLQDVLKEIAGKQNWDLEVIRILKLDVGKFRYGSTELYEIQVGFGKTQLMAKFPVEVASWNKLRKVESDFGSLVNAVSSTAVLSSFKVEGPFDLRVEGDDQLSLMMPMNITYNGLKRVLVGESITIEVSGAREVSVFHAFNLGKLLNQTTKINEENSNFHSILHSSCIPLLPVRILGSVRLVAYRTRNPSAYIRTTIISKDTVQLLPDKCHSSFKYRRNVSPVDSLNLRINLLENVLRRFSSDRIRQNSFLGFVKGAMKASTVVRFHIEIERTVGKRESLKGNLAEWRTRPTIQRVWYEVIARVEGERLKPLIVKKVKPLIIADSAAWSSLMSNISFTKFPSLLVPPEALTLDVKW